MKNFTKLPGLTVAASLLIAMSGTLLAQDPLIDATDSVKKERYQQRGKQQMPGITNMMRAIRHLDLSDDQKASFKEIMRELKAEERVLAKEMKAGHDQLKALIKSESYDEQAVVAVAEKEGALTAERLILTSRAMSEVYGQLTDEQRLQLETMAAERKARRAEKRGGKRGGASEVT